MPQDGLGRYAGPQRREERPLWETNPITLPPEEEEIPRETPQPMPASNPAPTKTKTREPYTPVERGFEGIDQEARQNWVQDNVWDLGLVADYGNGNIINPDTGEVVGTLPDFSHRP